MPPTITAFESSPDNGEGQARDMRVRWAFEEVGCPYDVQLCSRLGSERWLDGNFSAGDLMMASVLRRLNGSDLLTRHPSLVAYVARAEARPAFVRAFAAQRAVFENRPAQPST